MVATSNRLHSVEDMIPGRRYGVWFEEPMDKSGKSVYASSFVDEFIELWLGPDKQLYARFLQQDAIDIRFITTVSEAPEQ